MKEGLYGVQENLITRILELEWAKRQHLTHYRNQHQKITICIYSAVIHRRSMTCWEHKERVVAAFTPRFVVFPMVWTSPCICLGGLTKASRKPFNWPMSHDVSNPWVLNLTLTQISLQVWKQGQTSVIWTIFMGWNFIERNLLLNRNCTNEGEPRLNRGYWRRRN